MNYIAHTPAADRSVIGYAKAVIKRVAVDVAATAVLGAAGKYVAAPLGRVVLKQVPEVVTSTLSSALRSAGEAMPGTTSALREFSSGLQQGFRPWVKNTTRELEVATVETATTGRIVAQDALRTAEAQTANTANEVAAGARSAADSAASRTLNLDGTTYTYSDRVLARAVEDPGPMHNFPAMFDETIISQGTRTVESTGWTQFELPGVVTGKPGTFEIGGWPNAAGDSFDIVHRFFQKAG